MGLGTDSTSLRLHQLFHSSFITTQHFITSPPSPINSLFTSTPHHLSTVQLLLPDAFDCATLSQLNLTTSHNIFAHIYPHLTSSVFLFNTSSANSPLQFASSSLIVPPHYRFAFQILIDHHFANQILTDHPALYFPRSMYISQNTNISFLPFYTSVSQ